MAKPHILIIDDDVFILNALRIHLESFGCRVTHADSCQQARERLGTSEKVDLLILDYLMPDGSGIDLIQSLRDSKSFQKPPIIISSGNLDPKAPIWEELMKRLPADFQALIRAYVSKPYTLDAMDAALHEVLGGDYIPESKLPYPQPPSVKKLI